MTHSTRPNRSLLALAALAVFGGAALWPVAPAAAQAKHPREIQYPALPDFHLPKPERVVLPNGLVVLLAEDHELPLVRATVLVRTGSRLESADQAGLAELVGDTLRTGGTRTRSSDQIDEFLDGKGALIETSIDENQGTASMFALKEDFAEVFALLGEILREPVFDPARIEVAKTAAKADISRQNDDPQDILFRELQEVVYGPNSPYVRQPTYATVDTLDRDHLIGFHREYFQPNRLIVGLVGDFQRAEALALVEKTFGDWRSNLPAGDPNMFSPPPPAAGIYFIEKNDVTQSNIGLGDLGIVRRNPDYFAVELMNQVLSGAFSSRLFAEVRTKKGLAYNVFGAVGADYDKPGLTVMFTTTKVETTGAAIDALLLEARRMKTEPPSEEEVDKARRSILSSFIFQVDTPQKLLAQQLNYEYYGYPLDWLEIYRQRIESVTTDEVRAAAVKYLVPERFAIVVVGPKEGRDTDLTKYGAVKTLDISIPEPGPTRVAVTPEGQARAQALLEKAVAAVGGAARIDAIKTLRLTSKAIQKAGEQSMELQVTATARFPDHYRNDIVFGGNQMSVTCTPTAAFMNGPQGTLPMPESRAETVRRDFRRQYISLLKARRAPGFTATASGAGEVGGTPVERVQIDLHGDLTTLAIDPQTGQILESVYVGPGPGGAPGNIRQTYSDFRPEGGLTLAHHLVSEWNGQPASEVTVQTVELDPQVDPGFFEMPTPPTGR